MVSGSSAFVWVASGRVATLGFGRCGGRCATRHIYPVSALWQVREADRRGAEVSATGAQSALADYESDRWERVIVTVVSFLALMFTARCSGSPFRSSRSPSIGS